MSFIDGTGIQHKFSYQCNKLHMDGSNRLVNNGRSRDDIDNSDYRDSRTEWKHNSNGIKQLRDEFTADTRSDSNGYTGNTWSDKRDSNTMSGPDKPGIQYKCGSKCNDLYVDSTDRVADNGRPGNDIINSYDRISRTEREHIGYGRQHMRDEFSEYTGGNGTAGDPSNTRDNNRDGRSVSGINRTGLQHIIGHKCHWLYMDSTYWLVNNGRSRDDINNINYRHIRAEWKHNSNGIKQLRDEFSKDTGSNSITGDTGNAGSNNRNGSAVSGINGTGLQYIISDKRNDLYMDSTYRLGNYSRDRNYLSNSNNRSIWR
jgi:hypothetical protein